MCVPGMREDEVIDVNNHIYKKWPKESYLAHIPQLGI
jgi:hypothetical protein